LSFQKSGAAALASSAAIFPSRLATSKIPPERVEPLSEGFDPFLHRYVFHGSSNVLV
jgi:hypothetical protein